MQKRKMPTRAQIYNHWAPLMFDPPEDYDKTKTCWGCGQQSALQRCHIIARCDGGTDEVNNLLLLCKRCHYSQETICMDEKRREKFVELILDGAPFMTARLLEFKHSFEPYMDSIKECLATSSESK